METIAVLSAGEMGSAVGAVLVGSGRRVLTCLEERSQASARRAAQAGLESVASLHDLVRGADLLISIVPPAAALPQAYRVAEAISSTGTSLIYVDANSIGPHTAAACAATLTDAGADFVDGSIIGSASHMASGSRVLLSGPSAHVVRDALAPPLTVVVLGSSIGQASGYKVLYAGLTKGLTSLGIELLAGARALELAEPLLDAYRGSLPDVVEFWSRVLPELPPRAERRAQEMDELAETLSGLGLSTAMARGAQETLARVGDRARQDEVRELPDLASFLDWIGSPPVPHTRPAATH